MSIKYLPTICLWCISLFLTASCSTGKITSHESGWNKPQTLVKPNEVLKTKMQINFPKAQLTGILVAKSKNDTIRGAFVNEFGIKAFDFWISPNQGAVEHLPQPMDKWYIRKTLSADLAYVFLPYGQMTSNADTTRFELKKKGKVIKELKVWGDSLVIMNNYKRNITYQLKKIK
jgi:hypothetical protein